jgi:hypothetical protein
VAAAGLALPPHHRLGAAVTPFSSVVTIIDSPTLS